MSISSVSAISVDYKDLTGNDANEVIGISNDTSQIEISQNSQKMDNVNKEIENNEKLSASTEENILRGDMDISIVGEAKDSYNVGDTVYLRMGTEKSSYTPADIYIQVQGGGYTDNPVGTFSQATSSEGVAYTFSSVGTQNLRFVQVNYGTYYFSDYLSFNVVESGPSIVPGTYTDLQSLIDGTSDVLDLPYDFAYNESYDGDNFTDGVLINKTLTINGNGHTISGENLYRIFDVYKADVTINNVTLVNGNKNYGGAIIVSGSANLILKDSIVRDNAATQGAVHVISGSLTVEGTSFINNSANAGGAIYYNTASTLTVTDSVFEDNKASSTGGAILMNSGVLAVSNSEFTNNSGSNGGAINLYNFATSLTITDSRFNRNRASNGGAVYTAIKSQISITDSNFTENVATTQAGAVYLQNKGITANLENVNFVKNSAKEGGAFVNKLATTTIDKSTFDENSATTNGGAMFASGKVTITDSKLNNNKGANGAYQLYQTSENVISMQNTELISDVTPTINVEEVYDYGTSVIVDGNLDLGIYNQATNIKYTIDTTEQSTKINKNKVVYSIDLGSELTPGTHTISIKSFTDDAVNTYTINAVEKTFKVAGPILPGSYNDLQSLIDNATDVLDLPYDFAYNALCDLDFYGEGVLINKTLTINGNGHTISGENLYRIFDVYKADVTINNVTLVNGNKNYGSAIIVSGSANLILKDSIIKDNFATQGAIHVISGSLIVEGTSFINNTASAGGAIYYNTASTLTVTDSVFEDNKASSTGGAILMNSGVLAVSNSEFTNNSGSNGGAINLYNFATSLTITDSRFNKNRANYGGAVYTSIRPQISISDSNFTENVATTQAGAIYLQNAKIIANLENVNFVKNSAKEGGALVSKLATTTIKKSTFDENTATTNGGAIFASGKVTITESTLNNNKGADGAYQLYQTGENVISMQNTDIISDVTPTMNVEEVYDYGTDIIVEGTLDLGIYNQATNIKYTIDTNEQTTKINKNKVNYKIDLGSELNPGTHTISIKSFTDASGNTYTINAVEKTFKVAGPILPGSYNDLQSLIDNATDVLDLPYDFAYNPFCDMDSYPDGVLINKTLTINGNGHSISGEDAYKIFDLNNANVILNNITLTNGKGGNGGVILVHGQSTLVMNDVIVKNTVSNQGAIHSSWGSVTLNNCDFINNSAKTGAAVYFNSGSSTLTISDSLFEDNEATSTGTAGGGAAIRVNAGKAIIDGTSFVDNNAVSFGGAIYVSNSASLLDIRNSKFEKNNAATDGGAIYVKASTAVKISDSNFTENNATKQGGALYLHGTSLNADLDNILFKNNFAKEGGAIKTLQATTTINKSTFDENSATTNGGAIFASGKVTLSNSPLKDNTANNGYQIYQTGENIVSMDNTELAVKTPTLEIGESYDFGAEVIANGNVDLGIYNQALTIKYTIDTTEGTISLAKNKNNFVINLGSELKSGSHKLSIKSFTDDAGNTYIIETVEKTFTVKNEVKSGSDLQDLIDNAEEGSVIELGDVDYENVSNINITKNVTIKGNGNTTISSSGDGSPLFNVPTKSENGPGEFTISGINFLVNNGDTIVKVMTDNTNDNKSIDNPKINIVNNSFTKANDDVVTKSVTVLELDSELTNLAPVNSINISGNTLDDGIKAFQFEITSLSNGTDFNIPSVISGNDTGDNGSEKVPTTISVANAVTTAIDTKVDGKKGIYYQLTLKDKDGNTLNNQNIKVILNNAVYNLKTDEKGIAKLQLNIKQAGTYTLFAVYLGDNTYDSSFANAKIKVNKQKMKLSVSKKVFKVKVKTKKLKVTIKTSKGKAIKGKKVTFKIKGKTYKAKTNKKGVAKIKIKLNKKGTFKGKLKVPTDKTYKKLAKKIKIKIK